MNTQSSASLWDRPTAELARTMFQEAGDALLVVDPADLRVLDVNPVTVKLTGMPAESLIGAQATELIEGDAGVTGFVTPVRQTKTFHSRSGYRLRTSKPENWIPVSVTTSRFHASEGSTLALFALRDLRELREALQQAQRIAAELKRVLVSVQDCVWNAVIDASGRWQYAYLSPVIERLTGCPVERFLERPAAFRDLIYADDRQAYDRFAQELEAGRSHQAEYRLRRADGSVRWVSERVNCTSIDSNDSTHLFGILSDITERKQADEDLRRSEARKQAMLDSSLDAIISIDHEGRILDWNQSAERIFGRSEDSVLGKEMAELIIPAHSRELHRQGLTHYLTTGKGPVLGRRLELTALREDGSEFPIEVAIQPVAMDGPPVFTGFVRDISERKRAEESLRESEAQLRLFIEHAPAPIAVFDRDMRYLAVSQRWTSDYRLPSDSLIGRSHYEVFPEIPERWKEIHRRCLAGAVEKCAEDRFVRADGTIQWLQWELLPWHTASGDVGGLIMYTEDITERKRVEEAVRVSEKRYSDLVNNIDGIVWEVDARTFQIRFVSGQAERILGYPVCQWTDEPDFWASHIHPDDRDAAVNYCLDSTRRGEDHEFEYRMLAADGREVWLHDVVSVEMNNGEAVTLRGVMVDITERKLAEESLRESEERYRNILEGLPVGVLIHDGRRVHYANPKAIQMLGAQRPEDLSQLAPLDIVAPEYREMAQRRIDTMLRTGELLPPVEAAIVRLDGSRVDVEVNSRRTRLAGKDCLQVLFHDITERKRAADELRAAHERLSALFQYSPLALVTIDPQGIVQTWNPAAEHLFGWTAAEVAGRLVPTIPAGERIQFEHLVADATKSALRPGMELRRLRKDGTSIDVSLWSAPLHDAKGVVTSVIGMFADITERKRAEVERRKLEAQIQHAQKLESLGVLAGGIAHDFNNLLTSVLGYASLASMQLPDESPACPMLREIEQAAQRAADLTQQMLAYSGRGKFVIQVLRLDTLVQEMTKLLKTVVSKKAELHLALEPAKIEGDATQIRQVIMNLITNASDALEGEVGVIRVRTGVRHAVKAYLHSPFFPDDLPAGPYAFVEVEDTGCGMSAETLTKIFDPFFTTKFTGRGLGLAAVLGIIRGHRGTIKVASTPGRGTVFEVLLPCTVSAVEGVAAIPQTPLPRGQGTVLIIEDEPSVRDFAHHVLESVGFRVRTADDGGEGLAIFALHRHEIVVVLVDLTMPRMDGMEVLQQLRNQAPEIPVVVMSGFGEHELAERFEGSGASGFVQKPFRPRELVERVCQILSTRPAKSVDDRAPMPRPKG